MRLCGALYYYKYLRGYMILRFFIEAKDLIAEERLAFSMYSNCECIYNFIQYYGLELAYDKFICFDILHLEHIDK